jgi:hypothetical protein
VNLRWAAGAMSRARRSPLRGGRRRSLIRARNPAVTPGPTSPTRCAGQQNSGSRHADRENFAVASLSRKPTSAAFLRGPSAVLPGAREFEVSPTSVRAPRALLTPAPLFAAAQMQAARSRGPRSRRLDARRTTNAGLRRPVASVAPARLKRPGQPCCSFAGRGSHRCLVVSLCGIIAL